MEHARAKGIPERLVANTSATLAHEVLGQSILWPHALSIGRAIANHLSALLRPQPTVAADPRVIDTPVAAPTVMTGQGVQQLALAW